MASDREKWQEASARILEQLDIRAEYEAIGLNIPSGAHQSSEGWLQCHALGREDKVPSASINVGTGTARGRYKDFGNDLDGTLSLFDAAAQYGSFGDWKTARKHYADKAKVKLPKAKEDTWRERVEVVGFSSAMIKAWCQDRGGVSEQAVRRLGGKTVTYPQQLPIEQRQRVIGFPAWSTLFEQTDPNGWHLVGRKTHPIEVYTGSETPPDRKDKISIGKAGYIGNFRLLDCATDIIKCEGITDLATCYTQLLEAEAAGQLPEGRTFLPFTCSCGAGQRPDEAFLRLIEKKRVHIIHDADDPGYKHALVWATMLSDRGTEVRNVLLPYGREEKHGKDLRDWLLEGNSFLDLITMVDETDPQEITKDIRDQVDPNQMILDDLGLVVLSGTPSGGATLFAKETHSRVKLSDVDKLTFGKMLMLFGENVVRDKIHDGRETPDGMLSGKEVRHAIFSVAGRMIGADESMCGAGCWLIDERHPEQGAVLVDTGAAAILNGTANLEKHESPRFGSLNLDLSGKRDERWFKFEELNEYIRSAGDKKWCRQQFDRMASITGLWYWKHPKDADVAAGLITAGWLHTCWKWRPLIAVTGETYSGKSTFFKGILEQVYQTLAGNCAKMTESAVRQMLQNTAKLPIIDEFEDDPNRDKILEMARVSGAGGTVRRGTRDQKGIEFRIQHMFWFGAIEQSVEKLADRNRYIFLEPQVMPRERQIAQIIPGPDEMQDLGQRLLAIALRHFREARDMVDFLHKQDIPRVPGRIVENYALPCGMAAVARGLSRKDAVALLVETFRNRFLHDADVSDQADLVYDIWAASVMVDKVMVNISAAFDSFSNDADDVLQASGLRLVTRQNGEKAYFFYPKSLKRLLRGTNWRRMDIGSILLRLKDAQREPQRLSGRLVKGISVPAETIDELFDEREPPDDASVTANGQRSDDVSFDFPKYEPSDEDEELEFY